jgi:bacterioferritin
MKMKGNDQVLANFQTAVNALWSLATEYHLASKIQKHKSWNHLGHKLGAFGEDCEEAASGFIKQMLFLEGKPALASTEAKDDYGDNGVGEILDRALAAETANLTQLQKFYEQMNNVPDPDSAHDVKDVIHQVEKRIDWLESQQDQIGELGLVSYLVKRG